MRFFSWILGERGRRIVVGSSVGLFWSLPSAAIVFDWPSSAYRIESFYQTAWVTVLIVLALTVLFTLTLEEALGHRRALSALRCAPSVIACGLTSALALAYPDWCQRWSRNALGIETFAAIVVLVWAVRRWRRDRAAPLAEAIAVRSGHGRRPPARRD